MQNNISQQSLKVKKKKFNPQQNERNEKDDRMGCWPCYTLRQSKAFRLKRCKHDI